MFNSVVDTYMAIANANPPWSPDEERNAIQSLWDKANRDRFVNEALKHNLSLVFFLVHKYAFRVSDDVVQRAVIALSNALYKYNPDKGVKISTWVTQPIIWAIQQSKNPYVGDCGISEKLSALNHKYNRQMSVVSIDAKIGSQSDETSDTIGDVISIDSLDKNYVIGVGLKSLKESIRSSDISSEVSKLMASLPNILNEKETIVIKGIFDGKNLTEIAVQLKLSKMRISQISRNAFSKIRISKYGKNLQSLLK